MLGGVSAPKGLCYVSDKFKVIFVPIPKNASTSVRNISEFEFRTDNIMAYDEELSAGGEYKVFTIIREPVQRFVSGYIEICKRASGDSPHILSKDFYWMKGIERFSKFMDEIECTWFDAHLFPQSYFLSNYAGAPFLIDAYIEMEQLSTALPAVLSKYGFSLSSLSIPKLNVHGNEQRVLGGRLMKIDVSNVQRSLYYIMDYIVRCLQRRTVPTSGEIHNILENDGELLSRIKKILARDIAFVESIKDKMIFDQMGIYWRGG